MRTRKRSSKFAGDYQLCLASRLAVAYCRGSTEEQVNTLAAQQNSHRAYLQGQGLELVDMIIDSGTSAEKVPFFERAKIQGALALMQMRNVFHLLVTKTDRAFRNHEDCIRTCRILWEDYGISIHFVDEGLVSSREKDRMVLQIRASVAEEENRRRRERQLEVIAVMRADRQRCGQYAPYGKTIDHSRLRTTRRGTKSHYLATDPDQEEGLRRLFDLMQALHSTSKVARILNAEGVPTAGRPRWTKAVKGANGELLEKSVAQPARGIWYPATVQSVLEHAMLSDGTFCHVENRGGRLVFEFRQNTSSAMQETRVAA